MASSIQDTNINGMETDLKTIATIKNIANMDKKFVVLISVLTVSAKSFVSAASPVTSEVLTYFFAIDMILSIYSFTSSVAGKYLELIKII